MFRLLSAFSFWRLNQAFPGAGLPAWIRLPLASRWSDEQGTWPNRVHLASADGRCACSPLKLLAHIHFATPQIEEQRAWYQKLFGAQPGMAGRFKAADIPGVNLRWLPSDQRLPGIRGTSVDHIGFEVVNLEAFCKKLEDEGVKFDMAYRSVPSIGLSIAFLTDPGVSTSS